MPRHRLGVALLLDGPVAHEVDGIRRALGDRSLGHIPPHVTLVPPVNVRADQLGAALDRVRAAAAAGGPLDLTLGPPATFLPANPVVYLDVGGQVDRLRALRDAVFAPPLDRDLAWPWIPHVTLADDADPLRIDAALLALAGYVRPVDIDRIVLLEQVSDVNGRRWQPLADAALGPPAAVGRGGGLAVTLIGGRVIDPQAAALVEAARAAGAGGAGAGGAGAGGAGAGAGRPELVVTARREGATVGVAAAWRADDGGHIGVVVAASTRGQGIGTHLLAAAEAAVRTAGWDCPVLQARGPAGFYLARSRWSRPEGPESLGAGRDPVSGSG